MPSDEFAIKEHLGRPWAKHWFDFETRMRKLKLDVHECAGPNGWGGPAVTVPPERVAEVRKAARIKLDSHDVDGQVMLYPAPNWV